MKKKRALTLLEIMIVILLIGLISSVIGFSMKGSLDKGKKFKTEKAISQIEDILNLECSSFATDVERQHVVDNPEQYLHQSGLVKNASELIKDGWGYTITVTQEDGEFKAHSTGLVNFNNKVKNKK